MLKIKINLTKSSYGNLKYHVYRTNDITLMPTTVEELNALIPIAIIDESLTTIFYDNATAQNGVTYTGPVPSGLNKPELEITNKECILENFNKVPYLRLLPTSLNYSKIYYYNIVGVTTDGKHTKPSGVFSINLNHPSNEVKLKVEYSYNYNETPESATWTLLSNNLAPSDIIEIGNYYSPIYNTFSQITNPTVPIFDRSEFKNTTDGSIQVINIPNIWGVDKALYNTRSNKSYRISSYIGTSISDFNIIPQAKDTIVPIEKMILLKKDVTGSASPLTPLNESDDGVEILKMWIRKDGVYYDFLAYNKLPYNVNTSNSSVIIVDENSLFNLNIIEDKKVPLDKKFNYTVYTYDSYKNKSNPVTINIG